ncbi:MAG: hypothetical protein N2594_06260 [Clostridiales bacterium]|nr:hypothetical protein [Clostridiales bacterium]
MKSIPQKDKNIERKIKFLNIKSKFNDKKVSAVATFTYLELFKQIIGLSSMLEKGVSYKKSSNAIFVTAEIIEYLIDANILGYSRFIHTENLRHDEGYKKFKEVDRLPSEKVCRDLLKVLPCEIVNELREVNKELLNFSYAKIKV